SQVHEFDSQVDMQLSTDGGQTFRPARAPASVAVRVTNLGSSPDDGLYDTEMLALNIQGGDLPAGTMIRESPTEPSRGGTSIDPQMLSLYIGGGSLPQGVMIRESPTRQSLGRTSVRQTPEGDYLISSFFDIFTELTTDGGQSWFPALNGPVAMAATNPAAATVS